jgi:hypothetical protein
MNRHAFLAALGVGVVAVPLAAVAQQTKVARIGVLAKRNFRYRTASSGLRWMPSSLGHRHDFMTSGTLQRLLSLC